MNVSRSARRRDQHLAIAIAVLFLRRRRRGIGGVLCQQFTTDPIYLPGLGAVYIALHAMAIAIICIVLPLTVRPCLCHTVLSVEGARAFAGVGVGVEIAGGVVGHRITTGRG